MAEPQPFWKPLLLAMVIGLMLAGTLFFNPYRADAVEFPLGASVTVIGPVKESYGEQVTGSSGAIFTGWALGEPDDMGAILFPGGWIGIKLVNTVPDADNISIWAARKGIGTAIMSIFASADGENWTSIGNSKLESSHYSRYDFSGDLGAVCFLRVERDASMKSLLFLDAVRAGGSGGG